ncbi:tetratricopeptide repeat protein [Candidatus Margulisiibacteriota bacterium]
MNTAEQKISWNNPRIFDYLIEILILIVVFIMPTVFDRRLGIVFSGTKTTWMRVFGSIIFAVWSLKLLITRQHRFGRTPLDWPVVSFLLCTTIATLTSVHVYTSVAGFYGRYEGLTSWYLFGLFFFVVTNYIKSFEQLKRIIVTVVSSSSVMAIYSIIQRHEVDPYMWGGVVTWQRVIGTIGQPNFLAAYMLLAFFIILPMFMMKKEETNTSWSEQIITVSYYVMVPLLFLFMIYNLEAYNVLAWYLLFGLITLAALLFTFNYKKLHPLVLNAILLITLVLNYICILYTQSRGGYMGFFTGAVLFAVVAGRKAIFKNWRNIIVLVAIILAISAITMTNPQYSPFERFTSEITTVRGEDSEQAGSKPEEEIKSKLVLKGAAGSRGESWKSAFRIMVDYPLFGIGPEVLKMVFPRYETELFRFKEAFHVKQDRCHNETFDVSVTKGLTTFFVYIWLLWLVFRIGLKKAATASDKEKIIVAGLLAAVLAFLIQNQFSFGVVAITSLFWIVWAMIMVIGRFPQEEEAREFSWLEIPWLPAAGILLLAAFLIYVSFFSFYGDVYFKAGKTKSQMRRLPEAVADYEQSLKVFPFEGSAVSHLGISYLNLSRFPGQAGGLDQAVATFKYGTQIDPFNADNFYMLSKIYFMLKDLAAAQKYSEIALKIDPYYAEVYLQLGEISEAQGQLDKAALNYERAFFVNPNLQAPMQRLEDLNKRVGKSAQSLKVFQKALDKFGDNLVVLEKVGRIYVERGRLAETLQLAKQMLRLDPKLPVAHILRAEVFIRQNKVAAAFSSLQDVLLTDPRNIEAQILLGRVYLLKGMRERAREEFEQVLRLEPNNAQAKEMLEKVK